MAKSKKKEDQLALEEFEEEHLPLKIVEEPKEEKKPRKKVNQDTEGL